MCINGIFSPLNRLNSETEIQSRIFCEVTQKMEPVYLVKTTETTYKKSEPQRRSKPMVLYNNQLPKSHRGLTLNHQNNVALFRACMQKRIKQIDLILKIRPFQQLYFTFLCLKDYVQSQMAERKKIYTVCQKSPYTTLDPKF